jgi:hypothetical protein
MMPWKPAGMPDVNVGKPLMRRLTLAMAMATTRTKKKKPKMTLMSKTSLISICAGT